jgi:thioesterase domain-containing protein
VQSEGHKLTGCEKTVVRSLVDYLRANIPLATYMDIRAGHTQPDSLTLEAPLTPNWNDKGTAFGGSLATLCTLGGWTMMSLICRELNCEVDIVIARSEIRYLRPVNEDPFVATAMRPELELVSQFGHELESTGWATLEFAVVVQDSGKDAVRFTGKYSARLEV